MITRRKCIWSSDPIFFTKSNTTFSFLVFLFSQWISTRPSFSTFRHKFLLKFHHRFCYKFHHVLLYVSPSFATSLSSNFTTGFVISFVTFLYKFRHNFRHKLAPSATFAVPSGTLSGSSSVSHPQRISILHYIPSLYPSLSYSQLYIAFRF